jgi:hypothetical protein
MWWSLQAYLSDVWNFAVDCRWVGVGLSRKKSKPWAYVQPCRPFWPFLPKWGTMNFHGSSHHYKQISLSHTILSTLIWPSQTRYVCEQSLVPSKFSPHNSIYVYEGCIYWISYIESFFLHCTKRFLIMTLPQLLMDVARFFYSGVPPGRCNSTFCWPEIGLWLWICIWRHTKLYYACTYEWLLT